MDSPSLAVPIGSHCCVCTRVCHHIGGPYYCVPHSPAPGADLTGLPADQALKLGTMHGEVLAERDQLRAEVARLRAELKTFEQLFDLQQTRMCRATALWRAESPADRALVLPDLGDLLDWLIERGAGDAERYRVAQHGTFFATRESGRRVRAEVERQLDMLPGGPGVVLDFAGVEAITGGFADELVANLVVVHGRRITWTGTNKDVRETVERAIERRDDLREFPEDPADCEHGRWNPDNGQCLDCGDISPREP